MGKKKSSNPVTPFYSWGNWGSKKEVNFPKVPNLERSRAGSAAGPADIRALPPPLGAHATYHRSMRVSVLSHVTVCGDTLFTCQGLGLPACELFMVRSSFILCPPCCYTGNIMILWRYTERAMNLPRPHSTVLPKAETKGWERRGKEDDPASPCHCCSPTATPLPAKLPESGSHRATWSLHKGGSPFSPVPGPPQPCICWGLVKGLPTWLKNIFNINLNQNYTTMMDFHSKVFCHEFYGADLIFYVALLLYFQVFSILIILKWFWLPSVVFHVNIYPPSALYLDHILANYCICHCEFKGGFYSDQIQFSQSHFLSWVLSRFASPCSWCLPILGFSHC